MSINPHLTDQLAAAVAENEAHRPLSLDLSEVCAAMLRDGLPGADDELIGEIVLHVAGLSARLAKTLEERGYPFDAIAPLVSSNLASAGARLYRGQQ